MDILETVKAAKSGDKQAFAALYDEFADRIFGFIRIKIRDQAAEDVLQEVFIKAWRGLKTLDLEELNFSAWLYKIASNAINDYFRKYYRTPELVDIEGLPLYSDQSIQNDYSKQENIELIKKSFDYLPFQYKQILELRFIQDFTVDEVAEILGKTNLAVRLVQHRALKRLREEIEKNHALQLGPL